MYKDLTPYYVVFELIHHMHYNQELFLSDCVI